MMYTFEEQKIDELTNALEVAIICIEELMGSDADDSETLAYLRKVLSST